MIKTLLIIVGISIILLLIYSNIIPCNYFPGLGGKIEIIKCNCLGRIITEKFNPANDGPRVEYCRGIITSREITKPQLP